MIDLINKAHDKFISARRIDAIVNSEKFKNAVARSDEGHIKKLDLIFDKSNVQLLQKWMKQCPKDYNAMTKTELRLEAAKNRVAYYSRKTQQELVHILEELDEKTRSS